MRAMAPGSQAADDLLAQGVKLTAGQRHGGLVQLAEEIMSYVPTVSKSVQKARDRALNSWNQVIRGSKKAPYEAMKDMKNLVRTEYDAIFDPKRMVEMDDSLFARWQATLKEAYPKLDTKARKKLEQVFKNVTEPLMRKGGMIYGDALQKLDSTLGDLAAKAAKKDPIVSKVYKSAKDDLLAAMPDDMAERLALNNKAYGNFKVLESATSKVGPAKREISGTITPGDLAASASAGRRSQAALGQSPLQTEAATAAQVLRPSNTVQGFLGQVPDVLAPVSRTGHALTKTLGKYGTRPTRLAAGSNEDMQSMIDQYLSEIQYPDFSMPEDKRRKLARLIRGMK